MKEHKVMISDKEKMKMLVKALGEIIEEATNDSEEEFIKKYDDTFAVAGSTINQKTVFIYPEKDK
jgi:TRAP-type mannitol/chloroaromatic compound transport system substrate-binding protein